jgi:hypothetical protein
MLADFRESINNFTKDKSVWWHVLLWLFGLYIFVEMFSFDMVRGSMPGVLLIPYSFDFMLHEWAHVLTAWLPGVLTASAGSGSELLLGLGLVVGAFWFKNYFASLFCFLWFDLTLQSAGTYMADAIPQRLPLVSLGGALSGQDPVHDWHFVFGQMHLLGASAFIGNSLRVLGHVIGLIGVAFTAWLIYKMVAAAQAEKTAQPKEEKPWEKPPTSNKPIYPEATKGALAAHTEQPSPPADKTLEKHDNF